MQRIRQEKQWSTQTDVQGKKWSEGLFGSWRFHMYEAVKQNASSTLNYVFWVYLSTFQPLQEIKLNVFSTWISKLFSAPLYELRCAKKGSFGGVFSTILTQGGETPGGAGVAAALATGFAAAALTHARPGDSAPG